jgi:hypothetical protein
MVTPLPPQGTTITAAKAWAELKEEIVADISKALERRDAERRASAVNRFAGARMSGRRVSVS